MAGEKMSSEDRQKYSSIINDEAIRLTRLLDDLLDLSVLENGQVTLNLREDTVKAVLDRAVSATERPTGEKFIKVNRSATDEAVPLYTDSDRLTQVFINLISNAQKYCESDNPELTIAVKTVGGRTVVDFIDNGEGIPRAAQNVIFEKFSRVSDDRAAGGAGLGLAICREVMARLGGAIAYLPGQGGAAFRVTLPDAEKRAA